MFKIGPKEGNPVYAAIPCRSDGTLIRHTDIGLTDLNDLEKLFNYPVLLVTDTVSNAACAGWYIMFTLCSNATTKECMQLALGFGPRTDRYIRYYSGSSWGSWKSL